MRRLQGGFVPYRSAATAIARALGVQPEPDVGHMHGRIVIRFRSLGAWRWSEDQRMEYALGIVPVARHVLANDDRRGVRKRASRAIVVIYEDVALIRGCEVTSKWECVVPSGVGEQSGYRYD